LGPVIAELEHPPEVLLWVEDGSEAPLVRGALGYETALADVGSDLPTGVTSAWSGDDLYICYTGGTTGRPKGASWRQADFLVGALGLRHDSGEEFDSIEAVVEAAANRLRCLPAPPFMHGAAHWNALSCWADGGTVVIQEHGERIDPTDIVDTIMNHDVNSLLVVGDPVARPLIDHLRSNPAQPRSLRFILSGGAVLSADTRAALIELMPGVTVVDVLGSTESGRQGIARINDPAEADAAFTPSTDSVVLDADRQHVLAPGDDETGWLARSGRVPLGYLGDPERTAATFPIIDGLRYAVPGDRARWLSNGHVQLLGRDSVCINTGGEKVFVEEVEQSLLRHPAVLDVVVCGRPSRRWGEEVTAIVSLRSGARASDEELIVVAAETVARYKLPKAVIRVPTVQRSPSGKADYRWARAVANNEITPWSQLRSE
ncbi:MAG: AMP-binding protein, partial [Actinomycetota bacterium]